MFVHTNLSCNPALYIHDTALCIHDIFCTDEFTCRKVFASGAPPQTPRGKLTVLPHILSCMKAYALAGPLFPHSYGPAVQVRRMTCLHASIFNGALEHLRHDVTHEFGICLCINFSWFLGEWNLPTTASLWADEVEEVQEVRSGNGREKLMDVVCGWSRL